MRILIDSVPVEILHSDRRITTAQAEVLDVLRRAVMDGCSKVSSAILQKEFGFRSSLPLWSRLNHLIERGHLRLLTD